VKARQLGTSESHPSFSVREFLKAWSCRQSPILQFGRDAIAASSEE
jgi:hypothetical protein